MNLLAPGTYNDSPLAWKDFVSMRGVDRTNTIINFPITYIGSAGLTNNFGSNFDNLRLQQPLIIDTSAGTNINFFINNCRVIDLTFSGGNSPNTANNLFYPLQQSIILPLIADQFMPIPILPFLVVSQLIIMIMYQETFKHSLSL